MTAAEDDACAELEQNDPPRAIGAGAVGKRIGIGVARVAVFVSSDATFTDQPKIANGASEFFMQVLGDAGKHARAAVGVNMLPRDASVEVEVVFECR